MISSIFIMICSFIAYLKTTISSAEPYNEFAAHGQSYQLTKSSVAIPLALFGANGTWNTDQLIDTKHRVEFIAWQYLPKYWRR